MKVTQNSLSGTFDPTVGQDSAILHVNSATNFYLPTFSLAIVT